MSARRLHLSGLWVPVVTPFDTGGEIDEPALRALCRRVLRDGADGVVALGTTGEPACLTADERRRVVEACALECAAADRPLLVGTGTNCTRTTIDDTAAFASIDAVAGVLVVVPYYTRPSADAVVEHYRAVVVASPVPVVAYNIPYRTGRGLDAEHLLRLAEAGVVGVKQSVGGIDADTLQLLRDAPSGFAVLAGDDAFIAPTLLLGGAGAIAAAAHVCTPAFVEMVAAGRAGDVARCRRLAEALLPVVLEGFTEPSPAVWKAVLHHRGELASAAVRAPMSAASGSALARTLAAIAHAEAEPGVRSPRA